MKVPQVTKIVCAALFALVFNSCQSTLKPSGFLGEDDARMKANPLLPYGRSWKDPKADLSSYKVIAVSPVKTDRLRGLGRGLAATSERNIGGTFKVDAEKLAAYATDRFAAELNQSSGRSASVANKQPKKSRDTMVLETNLVEVVPGKPALQVLNFFIPFSALLNRPKIGMEGRFIDSRSGKTLFAFSDLEKAEVSLLDAQKFTYYGVQQREITRWAKQLRKILEGNASSPVPDAFPIQPLAW